MNIFTRRIMNLSEALDEDDLKNINPSGESQENNSDKEPEDNENKEDDNNEQDDVEDSNNEEDGISSEEINDNSLSSRLKELDDKLDSDLDIHDKLLKKKNLFTSFELLYKSLDYLHNNLNFYFNKFDKKEIHHELLNNVAEVKSSVYIYITNLYHQKSYLECKCFFNDVYVFLVEVNNIINSLKIDNNEI